MIGIGIVTLALILGGLVSPSPARADTVVIQEVVYDGVGADADDVFTELHGTPGMLLDGWTLRGINGADGSIYRSVVLTGATIPVDGLLVLATSGAAGGVLSARDVVAAVDWQNGPDAIQLLDDQGNLIDALQYGDAGIHAAGEGCPAPDVLAGWSLSRDDLGTDTNCNALDFTGLGTPTPGVGPGASQPVPEPASLALVSGGVLGLAMGRKRRKRRRSRAANVRHAEVVPCP